MRINKEEITRYIPQRAPFVMIDSLIDADEKGFESRFEVAPSNLFLNEGVLSESSVIENIAQTCAAGFGYVNSQKGAGEGQLGFIGAISRLKVHALPKLNDVIETKITVLNAFDAIHLIEGVASINNQPVLECQMKIVIA